jgi:hypothetical protein
MISLSDVAGLLLPPEKAYSLLGYKKDIICQELTCHFVPGEGLTGTSPRRQESRP